MTRLLKSDAKPDLQRQPSGWRQQPGHHSSRLRTRRLYDYPYGHNFLGFSTRLQSYINFLGFTTPPPLTYSVLGRKVCQNRIRAGQLFEVQSSYLNGYTGERAASDSRARLPREGSRGA